MTTAGVYRHQSFGTHGTQVCDCAIGCDHPEGAPQPTPAGREAHTRLAEAIGQALLAAIEAGECNARSGKALGVLADRLADVADAAAAAAGAS